MRSSSIYTEVVNVSATRVYLLLTSRTPLYYTGRVYYRSVVEPVSISLPTFMGWVRYCNCVFLSDGGLVTMKYGEPSFGNCLKNVHRALDERRPLR